MTTPDQYYVKADAVGNFAKCEYYTLNEAGGFEQVKSPLYVPPTATACSFLQHPDSVLTLQAAIFKTLPVQTPFTDYNYAASTEGAVAVAMPDNKSVTKGVVLMFSSSDGSQLFSSSDPEVKNNDS